MTSRVCAIPAKRAYRGTLRKPLGMRSTDDDASISIRARLSLKRTVSVRGAVDGNIGLVAAALLSPPLLLRDDHFARAAAPISAVTLASSTSVIGRQVLTAWSRAGEQSNPVLAMSGSQAMA